MADVFNINSTLLLTILLGIGLGFFLRASAKDRTTLVVVKSPLPPVDVLNGIIVWLESRGWNQSGGDIERKVLRFRGDVDSSRALAIFLGILGAFGSGSLGLVIVQLYPILGWWPISLSLIGGPLTSILYSKRARREEALELKLISSKENDGSTLKIRAHRDELIAMEIELASTLKLASDGSLLTSPI